MRFGHDIITAVFFATGSSRDERIHHLHKLRETGGPRDAYDDAVLEASDAYEALLLDKDPSRHSQAVFEGCQKISAEVLNDGYVHSGHDDKRVGIETEVAIHAVTWWGIASQGLGRYARLAHNSEDAGGVFGRNRGVDLIFRTNDRRHKIQAKSLLKPGDIQRYTADIVVISPQNLLLDPDARTPDLHEAISAGDEATLSMAWNSLLRELRTQKAPNGTRHVI